MFNCVVCAFPSLRTTFYESVIKNALTALKPVFFFMIITYMNRQQTLSFSVKSGWKIC